MQNFKNNYLIIGQGAVGRQVSHKLAELGCQVSGMARGAKADYHLPENIEFIQADASKITANKIRDFNRIAIIITPTYYTEYGYRSSYLAVAQNFAKLKEDLPNLERLVFISSTGVYGQNSGEWIDEHTRPHPPVRMLSKIILQAEQVLNEAFDHKCVIIRPSGIYGSTRLMRVNKAKEANKKPMPANAWTNRIMDTDLSNIIGNVLIMDAPKQLYIATDFSPVTSYELTKWLSKKLDAELPIVQDLLPTSGKRLKSNIPQEWIKFKTWQQGYQHILKQISNPLN
ncbi:MAG: NAD(P)-dependent oxidoreductase [Gammaproteobacteria bacterium]|nr:MAG: NAD(P)-dependent oxidoreductase [Gammaproteobacteria bacterium]